VVETKEEAEIEETTIAIRTTEIETTIEIESPPIKRIWEKRSQNKLVEKTREFERCKFHSETIDR